jgi:hypothetical protein
MLVLALAGVPRSLAVVRCFSPTTEAQAKEHLYFDAIYYLTILAKCFLGFYISRPQRWPKPLNNNQIIVR